MLKELPSVETAKAEGHKVGTNLDFSPLDACDNLDAYGLGVLADDIITEAGYSISRDLRRGRYPAAHIAATLEGFNEAARARVQPVIAEVLINRTIRAMGRMP